MKRLERWFYTWAFLLVPALTYVVIRVNDGPHWFAYGQAVALMWVLVWTEPSR